MTDHHRDVSQYKYSAMSNLVLQADRRFVTRRADEATGDPESLAGRLSIRDMGSRISRDDAPKPKKSSLMPDVQRGRIDEGRDVLAQQRAKRKVEAGGGILSTADMLVEGLRYRPRTPATRATFELILSIVAKSIGDVSHEMVRSAADAVLEFLKDDDLKDVEMKREIDDILGASMDAKEFHQLKNLGKKITDYDAQDDDDEEVAGAKDEEEIDDRQGVAVDFEDDDDDREGFVNEIRDESSEDEVDGEDESDQPVPDADTGAGPESTDAAADALDGEAMIIDSAPQGKSAHDKSKDANHVPAREIDAYWLQRQIGRLYPDAHTARQDARCAAHTLGRARRGRRRREAAARDRKRSDGAL